MADRGKLIAKVPLGWKKSFSQGVVIPHKMEKCSECKIDISCENCDKIVNQKKEFTVKIKLAVNFSIACMCYVDIIDNVKVCEL